MGKAARVPHHAIWWGQRVSLRKHGPHQGGIGRFNGADTAVNTPAGKPKILQVARLPPSVD
ncbi:hypothetical protein QC761_0097210 [Podospora bellae-mahoneyi]|uniref:Uncharacterized protein n=1 Tax=Podospora bellae-mahoneyi TaxID=2093777 RepID=A0ABR0FAE0_9PEZI|nr:hypothetical protein QC761_0097210 [Podospora bellae-mahoneyi]